MDCPVGAAAPGVRTLTGLPPPLLSETGRRALMLISDDAGLGVRLGGAAEYAGLALQQINDAANALRLAAQCQPAIVCLDLDLRLPGRLAVWEAAEGLLRDEAGPPLVFLSGRTGHFDLGAAIRLGAVVDKSAHPARLAEQVKRMLAEPEARREDRKARQRLLVRWLRPYDWSIPVEPSHRHWGINE